jgi:hypothetical protein
LHRLHVREDAPDEKVGGGVVAGLARGRVRRRWLERNYGKIRMNRFFV